MMAKECSSCQHFVPRRKIKHIGVEDVVGVCQRHPPRVRFPQPEELDIEPDRESCFPYTAGWWGCGEYKKGAKR